jgi:hypothetical protein
VSQRLQRILCLTEWTTENVTGRLPGSILIMAVKIFLKLFPTFVTSIAIVVGSTGTTLLHSNSERSPLTQRDLMDMTDQFSSLKTHKNDQWKVHTKTDPRFSYRVEYPSTWSVKESGNASFFLPPDTKSAQESISVVVINYKETPPLPIQYTYRTLRKIELDGEEILARKREPSAINEHYIAEIERGDYTIEFRFSLDRKYDEVFDYMISTFKFTM